MRTVCVIHQNDGTDVRVGKVCRTLSREYAVTYLGWDRDESGSAVDLGSTTRKLFARRARYGAGALWTRMLFVGWALVQVTSLRPSTVFAVNEELAFPLLLLRRLVGFRLVIDIHDPLADRVQRGPLHWILRLIQRTSRRASDLLIVTDDRRFQNVEPEWQRKAIIVPNFPNFPSFDVLSLGGSDADPTLRIAVIGSVGKNRGIDAIRRAAEMVGGVRLELAGWLTDDEAIRLSQAPCSRYHGILTMQDSLRLIASSDLVFCFYNPDIANNINASPNKIYEAICMGKRSIVNSETHVSRWLTSNGFGYACPYHDVEGLCAILERAKASLHVHRAVDKAFIDYASGRFYWEGYEHLLVRAAA